MTVELGRGGGTVIVVSPRYTVGVGSAASLVEVESGIISEGSPYEGPYNVIPSFEEQVLETRDKSMADDVTVEEIPVHRVSNAAGGITVSIGGQNG